MNHSLKLFLIKRWPWGCLLFCMMACNQSKEKGVFPVSKRDSLIENEKAIKGFQQIQQVKYMVKSGDLILRTGKDFTSELMRNLSLKDKTYSHCGIAVWESDTLFIYHAIGGEWNHDQKLRRDPFELFCNPYENRGFGIFRYRINNAQEENIIKQAQIFYTQKIMFDIKFDLTTDDKMYCSEFIYKTIKKATKDSVELNTTTLNHIKFVALDNLFLNPFCGEIKRVVFL